MKAFCVFCFCCWIYRCLTSSDHDEFFDSFDQPLKLNHHFICPIPYARFLFVNRSCVLVVRIASIETTPFNINCLPLFGGCACPCSFVDVLLTTPLHPPRHDGDMMIVSCCAAVCRVLCVFTHRSGPQLARLQACLHTLFEIECVRTCARYELECQLYAQREDLYTLLRAGLLPREPSAHVRPRFTATRCIYLSGPCTFERIGAVLAYRRVDDDSTRAVPVMRSATRQRLICVFVCLCLCVYGVLCICVNVNSGRRVERSCAY